MTTRKTSKRAGDVFSCPQFKTLRANLEQRGFALRSLWSTKSDPAQRYDNVTMFAIVGPQGEPNSRHGTMIVQDYGDDNGFGLWLDALDTGLSGSAIDEIVGPNPNAREVWITKSGGAFFWTMTGPDLPGTRPMTGPYATVELAKVGAREAHPRLADLRFTVES